MPSIVVYLKSIFYVVSLNLVPRLFDLAVWTCWVWNGYDALVYKVSLLLLCLRTGPWNDFASFATMALSVSSYT